MAAGRRNQPYRVLHADDAVLLVDKASGLAAVPGRGREDNLVKLLRADASVNSMPVLPVHRIDADTSGLLLFARSAESQRMLQAQFEARSVTKRYLAIVRGEPAAEGVVDLPIGTDRVDRTRMAINGLEAKAARTRWVVRAQFRGAAIVEVYPLTGRRHQIRLHLAAMGCPLAVDPLYGADALLLSEFKRGFRMGRGQEERPLLSRLALHAWQLTIMHPVTGAATTYAAEPPKDFRAASQALERWAR